MTYSSMPGFYLAQKGDIKFTCNGRVKEKKKLILLESNFWKGEGSFVYLRDVQGGLSFESTDFASGRIEKSTTGYKVNYHITDHLSSVRAIATSTGAGTAPTITSRMDYQPFGTPHASSPLPTADQKHRYTFCGKEEQRIAPTIPAHYKVAVMDQGARYYIPSTMQFTSQDPLAIKYPHISPYVYCFNNPVIYVDPDGRDAKIIIDGNNITITAEIIIRGANATQSLANSYQQNIKDNWGQINTYSDGNNTYNVTWDVSVRVAEQGEVENFNGINNYLDVVDHKSAISGSNHGNIRSSGIDGLNFEQSNPMAHEFGHLLGLRDRYVTDRVSYGQPISTEWKGNIMAEPSGFGKAESKNMTGILEKPLRLKKFLNPQNSGFSNHLKYEFNYRYKLNYTIPFYISKKQREDPVAQ